MKNSYQFVFSIVFVFGFRAASGQVMFSTPVGRPRPFDESDTLTSEKMTKRSAQPTKTPFVITFMGQPLQPVGEKVTLKAGTIVQNHFKAESVQSQSQSDSLVVLLLEDSLNKVRVQLRDFAIQKSGSPSNLLRNIPSILPLRIRSWADYRISSGFGLRYHPVRGTVHNHAGIDLPQPKYSAVYATADGIVDRIVWQPEGIGLAIYLKHASGYQTAYGHLEDHSVLVGESVSRGQIIGHLGETGMTTGPHLHYSVLRGTVSVDPTDYCFLLMKTLQSVKPALASLPINNKRKRDRKERRAAPMRERLYLGRVILKEGLIVPLKPLAIQLPTSLMALGKRSLVFAR